MKYVSLAALILLAACETIPTSGGPAAPPPSANIPQTQLELGDYRTAAPAAVLAAFEQTVSQRYGAGLAINAVSADLQRNQFNCGAAPGLDNGRGAPPVQVCRRTVTVTNCTHTWQVHLFEAGGRLDHTRGLYDRRCGNDGLLGGPG
jgi:hypothetical protein